MGFGGDDASIDAQGLGDGRDRFEEALARERARSKRTLANPPERPAPAPSAEPSGGEPPVWERRRTLEGPRLWLSVSMVAVFVIGADRLLVWGLSRLGHCAPNQECLWSGVQEIEGLWEHAFRSPGSFFLAVLNSVVWTGVMALIIPVLCMLPIYVALRVGFLPLQAWAWVRDLIRPRPS